MDKHGSPKDSRDGDLLKVEDLRTYFFTRRGVAKAVDSVSFSLKQRETIGLIGESGCGKTVTCLSILRLVPEPGGRIVGGRILFLGQNLLDKSEAEMRNARGSMLSMILQDPMTSLNPVFTVGNQVKEAIRTHSKLRGRSLVDKAREMLGLVRIPSPDLQLRNYPHQLSGGMRQRVAGAICISSAPRLLIADESTSSLDVTVQAQYLFLLKEIQQQTGMALIFVTHDLGIVRSVCDRVAVMYAGRVVETAKVKELFDRPAHPYTIALMKSVPKVEEEMKVLENIDGQPPSLYCLPKGCYFSPRCPDKHSEKCNSTTPPEVEVNDEHWVTCWQHA